MPGWRRIRSRQFSSPHGAPKQTLIEQTYPGQGVVVLRGGDHGAKVAAERRFRLKDGPRVLVCTAAGREGINAIPGFQSGWYG